MDMRKPYPSDLTDEQWELSQWELSQWEFLPHDMPPPGAVKYYFSVSDNPQIRAVLEYVEAREAELGEQAGEIRSRREDLTARLGELDAESENLRITRKALLDIPAPAPTDEPARPDVP